MPDIHVSKVQCVNLAFPKMPIFLTEMDHFDPTNVSGMV